MTDLYKKLGVSQHATRDEIKKAYRKKAIKHHPDKGGNAEEFHAVTYAYQVLTDEDKRSKYDNGESFETNSGQSPEQMLRENIFFIINEIMPQLNPEQVRKKDVVEMIVGIIKNKNKQIASESRKKRQEIGKFIQFRKRLSGEDTDWVRDAVWDQVEQLKRAKAKMQEMYDIGVKMTDKMGKWEYEKDIEESRLGNPWEMAIRESMRASRSGSSFF